MNRQDQNPGMDQPASASTDTGRSTTDAVKDTASQMTDKAQQVIGQATDQAKQQTVSQLSMRKNQAADNLNDVSQAVNQVGSQLRQDNHDDLAQYATMAAQQVSRAADYLRGHDINDMLDQAQNFARSQPAIFLAGAFALGLLGARFLKSSSPQQPSRPRAPSPYRYPSYQAPSGPYGGRYSGRYGGPYRGQYSGPGYQGTRAGYRSGYPEYGGTNGVARGNARNTAQGEPQDSRLMQGGSMGASDTHVPDAQRPSRR